MISVPSSSGKSLQLFLLAGKNEKMSNFSPLFIGEITSTGHVRGSRRCTAISVPSSSGKSLQPTVIFCSSLRTIISVPSSSGKSLQQTVPDEEIACREISVPSSSGKSLQLQFFANQND